MSPALQCASTSVLIVMESGAKPRIAISWKSFIPSAGLQHMHGVQWHTPLVRRQRQRA